MHSKAYLMRAVHSRLQHRNKLLYSCSFAMLSHFKISACKRVYTSLHMDHIVRTVYLSTYACCVTLSVGLPLIATTRSPFFIPFLSADDDGIGGDATASLPSYCSCVSKQYVTYHIHAILLNQCQAVYAY
jgi:hypothetical protein